MPKQTKVCRVCGATYEACKSVRTGSKVFNWREVACSPDCGMKYLAAVESSRSVEPAVEVVAEEPVVMRSYCKKNDEVTEHKFEQSEVIAEDTELTDPDDTEIAE